MSDCKMCAAIERLCFRHRAKFSWKPEDVVVRDEINEQLDAIVAVVQEARETC